ncbi:hypothetical protein GTQ43_11030 [Nostoc sp. KVJ3]|nr:hypothetical protein [Nostoc sp. KVJ3]MCW5314319.1 hypothetical protein [Nostoc sp. KVJ3]
MTKYTVELSILVYRLIATTQTLLSLIVALIANVYLLVVVVLVICNN